MTHATVVYGCAHIIIYYYSLAILGILWCDGDLIHLIHMYMYVCHTYPLITKVMAPNGLT